MPIELSRDPPSHFKSKAPLNESQIAKRQAKLATYNSGKKRRQSSKFGRLLAAAVVVGIWNVITQSCTSSVLSRRRQARKCDAQMQEHLCHSSDSAINVTAGATVNVTIA